MEIFDENQTPKTLPLLNLNISPCSVKNKHCGSVPIGADYMKKNAARPLLNTKIAGTAMFRLFFPVSCG